MANGSKRGIRLSSLSRGWLVVVVGPDGVGKTTLARGLMEKAGARSRYFHFLPPVRGELLAEVPHGDFPSPDKNPGGSVVGGWLRLSKNLFLAWLGYLVTVRPGLQRGCMIIGDRFLYGYVGQPRALRYFGPEWLARIALRAAPPPDLVVSLVAPAELVAARKAELTPDEIRQEIGRWAQLPALGVVTIDSSSDPVAMVDTVWDLIESRTRAGKP